VHHAINSWLESLGNHIVRNGWCDPYGTTIPPSFDSLQESPRNGDVSNREAGNHHRLKRRDYRSNKPAA